jgi:pyruvate/2-oxoglutarate/acetoin dehydrogenase E1 component
VWTTPISEAGIVGIAAGMALRGLRPVVEIMFGDFLTLAADQLINHASKFRWMYNDQVRVPLVVRTPMGGGRGYGPTHSQTLEKLFLGVPGLRVLAPCALGDSGRLLLDAIFRNDDPVLFIEHKLLYLLPLHSPGGEAEFDVRETFLTANLSTGRLSSASFAPCYTLNLKGAPPPVLTVAAYGYMLELARQAALQLAYRHEVFIELVAPTQLAPFDIQPLLDSLQNTHRLLTVEEGTHDLGWGAEILARAVEALAPRLHSASRLAALNLPIPASGALEPAMLPSVEQIVNSCLKIVQNR